MKKAKVLLLSPNLLGTNGGINRIQPGMGMAFLAAALRNAGHEVFVRDTALEGWDQRTLASDGVSVRIGETDEQVLQHIGSVKPNIIGISIMFANVAPFVKNLTKAIKSAYPLITIVLGGNYVTNAAKDYFYAMDNDLRGTLMETLFVHGLMDENIDYLMAGEADLEFPKLAECILNDGDVRKIGNLIYSDGLPIFTFKAESVDMGSLTAPAWDLFNMERYFEIGAFYSPRTDARKILPIMATRGCPEQCSYCTTHDTWGRVVR